MARKRWRAGGRPVGVGLVLQEGGSPGEEQHHPGYGVGTRGAHAARGSSEGKGSGLSLQTSCPEGTYWEMVPVVVALTTHSRSVVLKGTRTMLTFSASSRKLSGYTRWWVVLLPTSASNPAVGALFILGGGRREELLSQGTGSEGQF